jgi:regulator of sigma E protease
VHTVVDTTTVVAVGRGSPAVGVLRRGDKILAVDGRPATVASAQQAIAAHRCAGPLGDGCRARTPVALRVRRAGRELTLSIFPHYDKQVGRMLVGFDFGAATRPFGVAGAAGAAAREMWGITRQTLTNIGHAFTSAKVRHQFRSIVGITEAAHETVVAGAGYALVFLGFISLVLAVLNLFPFLPLDGGHVLWSVAEKLRGRRVSLNAMWRFSSVGIVLLVFLVLNGLSNDISRLTG